MATTRVPAVSVARIVARREELGSAPLPGRVGDPDPAMAGPSRSAWTDGIPARAYGNTSLLPTSLTWRTRADAAGGAISFNRLVDRYAGQVPVDVTASYRAAYEAAPAEAQVEFMVVVAGHLTLCLAEDGPDSISRAAALLTEWFLRPRRATQPLTTPSFGPVAASA